MGLTATVKQTPTSITSSSTNTTTTTTRTTTSSKNNDNNNTTTTMMLGGYSMGHLLKTANNRLIEKTNKSSIFCNKSENIIPKFSINEINNGKVLGRGGFCVVNEISTILLDRNITLEVEAQQKKDHVENDDNQVFIQTRNFMAIHYLREKDPDASHKKSRDKNKIFVRNKDARYAIKTLHDKTKSDASDFVAGLVDLMIEAKFLSVLRHPNIIHLRGVPNNNICSSSSSGSGDYFLVLDRLYDTLTKRIQSWKKQEPKGILRKKFGGAKKSKELLEEKYTVAYDLADALNYMHKKNIIYRDVKPDNIGFDVRGDVKMFDFGLAKELPIATNTNNNKKKMNIKDDNDNDDCVYNLTGMTGSLQYMAPEVALEKPYNLKADVYSFGILLWLIFTMENEPFYGYTSKMIIEKVIKGGSRPMISSSSSSSTTSTISSDLSVLMKRCWSSKSKDRPTISNVCQHLRNELNTLIDKDTVDELLDNMDDKSARSLHNYKMLHNKQQNQ